MVISMCGPLANKIKMSFQFPKKNSMLAADKGIANLINLLLE